MASVAAHVGWEAGRRALQTHALELKFSSVEAGRSTEASPQTLTTARSPLSPGPKLISSQV